MGRALRQMGEDLWLQGVAISTLAVALAIMGAYLALCLNLNQAAGRLLTGPTLLVVTDPQVRPEQGRELASELARLPGVASAGYVDQQEAMIRFRRQLGPQADLLDDLETNPLPNAIELVLSPDLASPPELAAHIKNMAGVSDVVTGRPWLQRLERALRAGGELAVALGILLFLAVVLVTSNTVRLAVHVRRRELELMALVGAGGGYMRGPFLVEAVLQGLAAAGLASLLLWGLFALLAAPDALPWGLRLGRILAFPALLPAALGGLAVVSGLMGGFLGVGRSLHPREVL
ncbi:MAG: permease-like cell division protein FtsX [Desulfarculaceae bacterium]|nr:permease-like cell division protein FtsX [Desulfarculaceae bacterium]MCF8046144.1 permease-like cell division protein FtsX [Desulfarculaceae bacterium]MCF8097171.1 permease-like cell division protein FtsX [Desulfarculaceae bacterium]